LRYLAINDTLAKMNGIPARDHIGKTFRDVLGEFSELVAPVFRQVFVTGKPVLNHVVSGVLPTRRDPGHWIENYFPIVSPTGAVQQVGAVVVEITKERMLEKSLTELNRRLMRARDEEQKRIARELHDSLNQYHTALKLNLGLLRRQSGLEPRQKTILQQSLDLLGQCIDETRMISHFLHPALLDMLGLESAARSLLRDFSRRTAVKTVFKSNMGSRRLLPTLELTLFRVLQEALTNVQRHANSQLVNVSIIRKKQEIVLIIADRGRGISSHHLRSFQQRNPDSGIGLIIMRERLEEHEGDLRIYSSSRGTQLTARLPTSKRTFQPASVPSPVTT
jgi:two-component system NarL family sensor kinase